MKMAHMRRNCELCDGEATTYCPSDNAFLCAGCDEKVHGANFLVARHVRVYICPQCWNIDDGNRFSGTGVTHAGSMKVTCESCSPHVVEDDEDDTLSSSSSCVSSTGEEAEVGVASASSASSRGKRRDWHHHHHNHHHHHHVTTTSGGVAKKMMVVDAKLEGVLVNWCMRMGLEDNRVVPKAVELVSGWLNRMTILPFRVLLAAALWTSIRLYYDGDRSNLATTTCQELKRLEQISGVPAKMILATESRLARVIKRRQSREDHEEGWAEC